MDETTAPCDNDPAATATVTRREIAQSVLFEAAEHGPYGIVRRGAWWCVVLLAVPNWVVKALEDEYRAKLICGALNLAKVEDATEPARPHDVSDTAKRIEGLAALSPGWDDGALGIAPRAIQAALRVARLVAGPPAVVPTVDGGVQLEWHGGGFDIEIETFADGHAESFVDLQAELVERAREALEKPGRNVPWEELRAQASGSAKDQEAQPLRAP